MDASDTLLVIQTAEGDVAAFAALYDRFAPRVFGLIVRLLGKSPDAEDVLQEVFWQAWSKAGQYEPNRASPLAWLFMIARSRVVDRLRKTRPHAPAADAEPAVCIGPDEPLLREESVAAVTRALQSLPDTERTAIELAFFEGLTQEQVARRLAVPLGTTKSRIRIGMQRLRRLLQSTIGEIPP
jgi:RNA polymerase sigma-70 factor (ECF subfamily)